ncbi:MAG: response regulator [Thermoanaerobaculia bacterium]
MIVDDHPMIHEVLRAVAAKAFPGAQVHDAFCLEEALQIAARLKNLEVVLFDLGLPDVSGVDALARFRRKFAHAKIVVVSASDDRESVMAVLSAGACGFIPKTYKPTEIIAALQVVAAGQTYVPSKVLAIPPGAELDLGERQVEVLRLLLKGMSNRDIAGELSIAESTVKHHTKLIYNALGVESRAEAFVAAQRRGLKM